MAALTKHVCAGQRKVLMELVIPTPLRQEGVADSQQLTVEIFQNTTEGRNKCDFHIISEI